MSLFSNLFRKDAAETRAFDDRAWATGDLDFNGGTATNSGISVTPDSALQLSAVWASVRLYAHVIASLPLSSYIRFDGVRKPLYPRPVWLDKPNNEDRLFDFLVKVVVSLLLNGNTYVFVVRDRTGAVLELIVLDPTVVSPVRHPDTNVKAYILNGDYAKPLMDTWDVVHIRHLAKAGSLLGLSPIAAQREMIGLGVALNEYGSKFFSNGAHLSGVIETKEAITPEQAAALRAGWSGMHSGLRNAHKPGVLSAASYRPLSVSPDEAQFLQSRQYSAQAIAAQVFGVPPHMIGESGGSASNWGTGIEATFNSWLSTALAPILENIETALSTVVDQKGFVKFKSDALLRTDAETRVRVQRAQVESGFLSIDEVRAMDDRAPLPDGLGAQRFRPSTWVPLDAPAPAYLADTSGSGTVNTNDTDDTDTEDES